MIEYYDLIDSALDYPEFNSSEILGYEYDTYQEAYDDVTSGHYYESKDTGDIVDVHIVRVQFNDAGEVSSITEVENVSFTKEEEPSNSEHSTMSRAYQGV